MDENLGGYDLEFTEPPPKSLECGICIQVFRDPHLISCCGQHFCGSCITKVMMQGKNCPLCNQPGFTVLLDKGLQRKVHSLKINCVHKDRGCVWTGELGKLENHIHPKGKLEHGCKFEVVECSQGCGEKFQRRFVRKHQTKICICRPYNCDYCEYGSIYEDVRRNHWPVCPNYPVHCPSGCEVGTVARKELDRHLTEECPLHKIECEFSYAGCKAKVRRKDMPTHMSESFVKHLSMLSAVNKSLLQGLQQKEEQIAALKREKQVLRVEIAQLKATHAVEKRELESKVKSLEAKVEPVCPFSFTMPNFEQHQQAADRWYSPFFYSHPKGYKMCIKVEANGIGIGKGSHISVSIHFAKGRYDRELQWPFKGSVIIRLLNQRADKMHYDVTIPFMDETPVNTRNIVTVGSMATWGWGCHTFLPHEDLQYSVDENREFLTNNCLQFTVMKVETHP